ncbi:peptide-methionine (R)-S-oxide reductase MsrB [archaeon]|nr:peptide-methionine (R)-S-oxide reductase MsrB [archaeon]
MFNNHLMKSESEWREELTPEQYRVLRKSGTEPPYTGRLLHKKEEGIYHCAACGNKVFNSDTKFESGTGWPSFNKAVKDSVILEKDATGRIEVRCAECGSHLGHVFNDGPKPTGKRYCINSIALNFKGEGE